MRKVIAIAALGVLSCTRPAQPSQHGQDFFARELAGHVAQAPKTCINSYQSENLRVIDSSTIAYGSGRTIYVNKLPGSCPAMQELNTLQVMAQGSQYCRGDRIRGIEPGAIIPGPWCVLGDWTPYTMK